MSSMFGRSRPAPPTAADIQKAGRLLQQGGTAEFAEHVVDRAKRAGLDGQATALRILDAAADYEPTEE
ncbi:hypothetical protein [Streptomyces sp. NPDC059786]|uniref:hypothetical protein n=1 Tax=Streptomyces sp. NPDC059786 TaxID=3346946 RepID=UPI00365645F6